MIKEKADSLMLKGHVANLNDGGVEIVLQGDGGRIEDLTNWLKKSPGLSQIENIKTENTEEKEKYKDFKIKRNASYIIDRLKGSLNLGRRIIRKNK